MNSSQTYSKFSSSPDMVVVDSFKERIRLDLLHTCGTDAVLLLAAESVHHICSFSITDVQQQCWMLSDKFDVQNKLSVLKMSMYVTD